MSYFVPPCNYGMVEYDLSRSGQCHQLNFPFLERLNLKTVIYLSYDQPSHAFLSFLDDQGIELRRPSGGDEETDNLSSLMSEAEVLSALQVILSPQNYPLHVMCKFGHHRTGTILFITFKPSFSIYLLPSEFCILFERGTCMPLGTF
ncbi:hypothetical protein BDL97_19G004700 [Sphagnum fallax]|nr:hypothetical protein BDL97_19G004700 [Sphagnum fallax]KAH8931112.1 hypothetical protein BDL97_19G004700 [Sphagnum fallax]